MEAQLIIEKGLCRCGCGQKTSIAKQNNTRYGWIKGQPVSYIKGHYIRGRRNGSDNYNWKGGKKLSQGYIFILKPNHPRANSDGYVQEHILIAEKALGKPLPEGVVVHHANGNKADNRNENLVICEDENYHRFLHLRIRNKQKEVQNDELDRKNIGNW